MMLFSPGSRLRSRWSDDHPARWSGAATNRRGRILTVAAEGVHLGVVFSRLLQSIKLQRDAFVWMDFNDRATGDAAILVAITQILIALGTGTTIGSLLNPITLLSLLFAGLIFWLMYSGAAYAIVRFLFDGSGTFPVFLRVAGFAYPTLLLLIVGDILFSSFLLILLVGAAWFVVIVAHGIMYIGDLDRQKSFIAAVGAYAAVMVIQSILASIRIF